MTEDDVPLAGALVSVRAFARPLLLHSQRRAAFESCIAATSSDHEGRWEMTLPRWIMAHPGPLAVVVSKDGRVGSTSMLDRANRRTHRDLELRIGSDHDPDAFASWIRKGRLSPTGGSRVSCT